MLIVSQPQRFDKYQRPVSRCALVIFVIAILVRAAYGFYLYHDYSLNAVTQAYGKVPPLGPDSPRYELLGLNIIRNGSFCANVVDDFSYKPPYGMGPEVARTPGYPLFLGLIYWFITYNPLVVVIIQLIIDACLAYVIFYSSLKFTNLSVAFFLGLGYAMNLRTPFVAGIIQTEQLFLLFQCFLFLAMFYMRTRTNLGSALAYGGALAVCAYIRPHVLYYPVVVLPVVLWEYFQGNRRCLRYFAVALLLFAILVAPWMVRNQVLAGRFTLSVLDDWNYGFLYAPRVIGVAKEMKDEQARYELVSAFVQQNPSYFGILEDIDSSNCTMHKFTHFAFDDTYLTAKIGGLGKQAMLDNWYAIPMVLVRGLPAALFGGTSEMREKEAVRNYFGNLFVRNWRHSIAVTLSIAPSLILLLNWSLFTLILVCLFLIGSYSAFRDNDSWLISLALIVLFNLFIAALGGYYRHFVPAYPALFLLSARPLEWLMRRYGRQAQSIGL